MSQVVINKKFDSSHCVGSFHITAQIYDAPSVSFLEHS